MSDHEISVTIDLDSLQNDWDSVEKMAKQAGDKIKKAIGDSDKKITKDHKKETADLTKEFAKLDKEAQDLIQTMQKFRFGTKADTTAIARMQREANELRGAFNKLRKSGIDTTSSLDQLAAASNKFNTAAKRGMELTGTWWQRFGAVAVGFGVAYRAINVLENGIAAYVDILKEGLTAQDEFIELQGKLAMYSQLYGSNASSFAEGFELAATNVRAFREELPMAISGVGDLTQGIDEFVQHGYAIAPMTAHGMVNFLDFTSMVATTVGSTSKQIRQEIQSLFEGTQRAGNTVLRLLKSLIPEFDKFLEQMRGKDTEAAMDELFERISKPMDELKKRMIEMSASKAHIKWRKELVLDIQAAAELAAQMQGLAKGTNIFASVFNKHSKGMSELAQAKLANAFISLAAAMDSLLASSGGVLEWLARLTSGLALLTNVAIKSGPIITYAAVLYSLGKAITFVGASFTTGKVATAMTMMSKRMLLIASAAAVAAYGLEKLTESFKLTKVEGQDLDDILGKAATEMALVNKASVEDLPALDLWLQGKMKASEVLEGLANNLEATSVEGEAFWKVMNANNVVFKETGVVGTMVDKVFGMLDGTIKKLNLSTDAQYQEWLKIVNGAKDLAEAMEIAKGVTLSFYSDLKKAMKAGDVEKTNKLIVNSMKELVVKFEDTIEKIKKLQVAVAEHPGNDGLILALAQLNEEADELERNILDITEGVAEVTAGLNHIKNEYKIQLNEIKDLAASTGKDVRNELDALNRDFLNQIQELLEKFGISASDPRIKKLVSDLHHDIYMSNKDTVDDMEEDWEHLFERLHDLTADWLYEWEFSLDSLVDLFRRTAAEIAATWIWGDQSKGFSFANMFGGSGIGGNQPAGSGSSWSNFASSLAQNQIGGWVWDAGKGAWAYLSGAEMATGTLASGGAAYGMGALGESGTSLILGSGGTFAADLSASAGGYTAGSGASAAGAGGWGSVLSKGAGYAGIGYLTGMGVSAISGDETHPEYASYGGAAGGIAGGFAGGAMLGAQLGSWAGPVGAVVGGVLGAIGGSLFGGGREHRPHAGLAISEAQWNSALNSFDFSGERSWPAKTDVGSLEGLAWAYKEGGSAPEELAQGLEDTLKNTADMWKDIFENLADLMGDKGEEWLRSLEMSVDLSKVGGRVEDEEDFINLAKNMNKAFYKGAYDNLYSGMSTIWDATKDDFADVWGILQDNFKESMESEIAKFPELDIEGDVETELAKVEEWIGNIGQVRQFLSEIIAVTSQISKMIELHGYSDSVKSAVTELDSINQSFGDLATTLKSAGVDLEKYTDLEVAHQLAIQDAIYSMSSAGISGEDLAISLRFVADEMLASGETAEAVAEMYRSSTEGIKRSIKDIQAAHDTYGQTALDNLSAKYGIDLSQYGYADWERFVNNAEVFDSLTVEMQQDLRNLGVIYEGYYESLHDAAMGIRDNTQAMLDNGTASEELVSYLTDLEDAMVTAGFTTEQVAAVMNAAMNQVIRSISEIYQELKYGKQSVYEQIASHYEGASAGQIEAITKDQWIAITEGIQQSFIDSGAADYNEWAKTTYGQQIMTDWEALGRTFMDDVSANALSGGRSVVPKQDYLSLLSLSGGAIDQLFGLGADWIVKHWYREISQMVEGEQRGDTRWRGWIEQTSAILEAKGIYSEALSTAFDDLTYQYESWVDFYRTMIEEYQAGNLTLEQVNRLWPSMTEEILSYISTAEDSTAAAEDMASAMAAAAQVMEEISQILSYQGLSGSAKSALSQLSDINKKFKEYAQTLTEAGITDFTELQQAYKITIEDWVKQVFTGAIGFATTSQNWTDLAGRSLTSFDAYQQQYQEVARLMSAYDGTISSATDLSDAFSELQMLSINLAQEISQAITVIQDSYSDLAESIRLSVMSEQQQYDYYRNQIATLFDQLATVTDPSTLLAIGQDIREYVSAAWGIIPDEQRSMYADQFARYLEDTSDIIVDRLEDQGEILEGQNKSLVDELRPLLGELIQRIDNAAVIQIDAANTQVAAANGQLTAAGMPINVVVTVDGSEVG